MKGEITGWGNTDAVNLVNCPRCGQKAGDYCRMPSGCKIWPPHNARVKALSVTGYDKMGINRLGSPVRQIVLDYQNLRRLFNEKAQRSTPQETPGP
jgi:hypothetical protein